MKTCLFVEVEDGSKVVRLEIGRRLGREQKEQDRLVLWLGIVLLVKTNSIFFARRRDRWEEFAFMLMRKMG